MINSDKIHLSIRIQIQFNNNKNNVNLSGLQENADSSNRNHRMSNLINSCVNMADDLI